MPCGCPISPPSRRSASVSRRAIPATTSFDHGESSSTCRASASLQSATAFVFQEASAASSAAEQRQNKGKKERRYTKPPNARSELQVFCQTYEKVIKAIPAVIPRL